MLQLGDVGFECCDFTYRDELALGTHWYLHPGWIRRAGQQMGPTRFAGAGQARQFHDQCARGTGCQFAQKALDR